MSHVIDLTGQVAIVTGAGRGLGAAMAKQLAGAGAQVVVVDISPAEEIQPGLDAIAAAGLEPLHLMVDISSEENCKALVAETIERFGRVDILVNNAAVARASWEASIGVNLMAQYHLNMAAYEDMKKRHYGKIVNITTSGTFSGGGVDVKYNATKGAADSMTRYLGRQFAADGVSVNAVAPGPVLTELMSRYYGEEVFVEHYLPQMPLKRLLTADDIANTVLFLCTPLSDAMCGATLLADGGRVLFHP